MNDDLLAEVLRTAHDGKKIEAIKLFRQHTGVGLKEAKDAVEALMLNPYDAQARALFDANLTPDTSAFPEPISIARASPAVSGTPPGAIDEVAAAANTLALEELIRLARSDKKLEAIKLFRERTGIGLKEAKDAVEALMRDPQDARAIAAYHQNTRATSTPPSTRQGTRTAGLDEVYRLLEAGQKIEAIKLYREHTGVGLKEAKDAVEALEDSGAPTGNVTSSGDSLENDLRALLSSGQQQMAVERYRAQTGAELDAAQAAIATLIRSGRLPGRRSATSRRAAPAAGASANSSANEAPIPFNMGWFGRLFIFGIIYGILGLGLLQIYTGEQQRQWPTTPGVITSSRDCKHMVNGSTTYSGACVSYTYSVNEQAYEWEATANTEGMEFQKFVWSSFGIPATFTLDAHVPVYYDPTNPTRSTLEPGATLGSYVIAAIGALLSINRALAYVRWMRRKNAA